MFKWGVHLYLASVVILSGCATPPSVYAPVVPQQQCSVIYTYGDASYDRQLEAGISPIKLGAIPVEQVTSNFPKKFLELDGSYGGGRVFCTIEAAEAAIIDAENKNILSKGESWGIYEVEGDWQANTYELKPNDHRLRHSSPVLRRVK